MVYHIPIKSLIHPYPIDNNTVTETGGDIYLYRSTVTIRNCDFEISTNSANEKGGGIHLVHSDIKAEASSKLSTVSSKAVVSLLA